MAKRAVCVVTGHEINPFWGIVVFDDKDTPAVNNAVYKDFCKRFTPPPGETHEDWIETILGEIYEFYVIPSEIGEKLRDIEFPSYIGDNEEAQICMEMLMIKMCEAIQIGHGCAKSILEEE